MLQTRHGSPRGLPAFRSEAQALSANSKPAERATVVPGMPHCSGLASAAQPSMGEHSTEDHTGVGIQFHLPLLLLKGILL